MIRSSHIARLRVVVVLGVLFWMALVARLSQIQLIRRDAYVQEAKEQQLTRVKLGGMRGEIRDRFGRRMAINMPSFSYFYVPSSPSVTIDPRKAKRFLLDAIGGDENVLYRKIKQAKCFIWLSRKVDKGLDVQIPSDLKRWGVGRLSEMKRWYPFHDIAGQLLGYTNVDNIGIEGAELGLDSNLGAKPGWQILQKDGLGRICPEMNGPRMDPQHGNHVFLTLSLDIQQIVEEELASTVERLSALSGMAVAMDPRTGEILAMANVPRFDPNTLDGVPPWIRKNRTLSDMYEPGSTFKVVTARAALEDSLVSPQDSIFCEEGAIRVAGGVIRDAHPYGWLTFQDVIEKSSNVGTIKVARIVGPARLYASARLFGFGCETGIELLGEAKGMLRSPSEWSRRSLASIAIGQEVAVTALQLANAYAAIANGGVLMRPQIVKAVVDRWGNVKRSLRPEIIRRVMSRETAQTLTSFLEGVVSRGTGTRAQIPGLRIAGKTGTAQKAGEQGEGFIPGVYVASFVGFVPVPHPSFLCLVVVDTPKEKHYGGQVAAPTFKRMVERIISLPDSPVGEELREALQRETLEPLATVPDVRDLPIAEAIQVLAQVGLHGKAQRMEGFVRRQSVRPGTEVRSGGEVALTVEDGTEAVVPDVRGMPLREAVRCLTSRGVQVRVRGGGVVQRQNPPPGVRIRDRMVCLVEATFP